MASYVTTQIQPVRVPHSGLGCTGPAKGNKCCVARRLAVHELDLACVGVRPDVALTESATGGARLQGGRRFHRAIPGGLQPGAERAYNAQTCYRYPSHLCLSIRVF